MITEKKTDRRERRHPSRRKPCKFCADRVAAIDYKDVARLQKCTSERGKILPADALGAGMYNESLHGEFSLVKL